MAKIFESPKEKSTCLLPLFLYPKGFRSLNLASKRTPRGPMRPPRGPQETPRGPHPRGSQKELERPPRGPTKLPEGYQTPQIAPKRFPRGPKRPEEAPNRLQEAPKRLPKGFQETPRSPRACSREVQIHQTPREKRYFVLLRLFITCGLPKPYSSFQEAPKGPTRLKETLKRLPSCCC